MQEKWIKPDYQVIEVGGECTAYAAARILMNTEHDDAGRVASNQREGEIDREPVGVAPSGPR
jgi:hypothetical protein